jgi:anti-anti-sigma factor
MSDDQIPSEPGEPGYFGWSQRSSDGVVVVRLVGELDMPAWAELGERLMRVAECEASATVVLDMSDVRFMDAHSAGLIITAWAAAHGRGRVLQVDGLHGIAARVFALLGCERMLVGGAREDDPGGDVGGRANGRRSVGGTHEAG